MARFSKRGRNPGAADFWLESLGYYRKNVAYDETCLFRAVSEQLFSTQIKHEEIRKKCITYGQQHSRKFAYLVPRKKDWYDRLKKLAVHMVVCNEIEVQLVCYTYKVNITIFIAATNATKEYRGDSVHSRKQLQTLLLCKMGEDHYDAVYPKEHIADAGFCQSIVYNTLYEKVFGIEDAESIAYSMLHDKQTQYVAYSPESNSKNEFKDNVMDCDDSNSEGRSTQQQCANGMLAPFPFKIAKALDPNMYRNIEYDTWIEQRREMRLGEWYYGDDKLILGTRCLLNIGGEELECYIQTMFENDRNKCEVYITKLAERVIVNYSDLKPEANAKPWPLPYRFARGQPAVGTVEACSDNERKTLRKRREKKRSQYNGEQNNKLETQDTPADVNISNYEGYPLLMQDSTKTSPTEQQLSLIINKDAPEHTEEHPNTPLSGTISWSQSSSSQHCQNEVYPNDDVTVTPHSNEPINYQETANNEIIYTYIEPGSAYPPLWQPQDQYIMTPDSAICEDASIAYRADVPSKYVYYATDSAYASPTYPSSLPSTPYVMSPYPIPCNNDNRMMCTTPIPVTSAQSDMYPFIYHPISAPGTPTYYPQLTVPPPQPMPNQRPPEFNAMPTPPPPPPFAIYTPPAAPTEVPYSGFVYPTATPPVAWYNPPHINSQGFIFPVPPTTTTNATPTATPNSPHYM